MPDVIELTPPIARQLCFTITFQPMAEAWIRTREDRLFRFSCVSFEIRMTRYSFPFRRSNPWTWDADGRLFQEDPASETSPEHAGMTEEFLQD